jgi:hypothetical protein
MNNVLDPRVIESIRSAFKNNNEYFWDAPSKPDNLDATAKYAAAYFKLAPKWIELNEAVRNSIITIEIQAGIIASLSAKVSRLVELCDNNAIPRDDIDRAEKGPNQ